MFTRNEKGKLVFKRLDFEIMIDDIYENTNPNNMSELKWMVECMVDAIQLCAQQHVENTDSFDDEWEDVFYPA